MGSAYCEQCTQLHCSHPPEHLFQAIPNAEREELWQDFLRDKEKRERDAKRAVRRERAAAFRDLLLSTPAIKVAPNNRTFGWNSTCCRG